MADILIGYDADGNSLDYTTLAAGISAASPCDRLLVYYSTNAQGIRFGESLTVSKCLSIIGMLGTPFAVSKLFVGFQNTGDNIWDNIALYNRSAWDIEINLLAGSSGTLTLNRLTMSDGLQVAAVNGATVKVKNSISRYSTGYPFYVASSGDSPSVTWQNCMAIGADGYGFWRGIAVNCVGIENRVRDFSDMEAASDYNVSTDSRAPGANSTTGVKYSDIDFLSEADGSLLRVSDESPLVGAGTTTGQPTTDIYGVTYPSGTIGCMAGIFVERDKSNVLVGAGGTWVKADRTKVQEGNDFGVGGTSEVATLDNDNIIESAGGDYHVLETYEVQKDVTFGPDQSYTGTYDPTTVPGTPGLTFATAGDTQVTLSVIPAVGDEAVPIHAYYWTGSAAPTLSSQTITGAGDLTITGLANGSAYGFMAVHKNGAILGAPSGAKYSAPTDGTESEVELVCEAVALQITTAGLVDADGAAITAAYEIPPKWEGTDAEIIVFPGPAPLQASHSQANHATYGINVAICERTTTDAARSNALRNREKIQDMFVGSRLDNRSSVYVSDDKSTDVLGTQELHDNKRFISVLSFECERLRART